MSIVYWMNEIVNGVVKDYNLSCLGVLPTKICKLSNFRNPGCIKTIDIRTDSYVNRNKDTHIVLDCKWENKNYNPFDEERKEKCYLLATIDDIKDRFITVTIIGYCDTTNIWYQFKN